MLTKEKNDLTEKINLSRRNFETVKAEADIAKSQVEKLTKQYEAQNDILEKYT